MIFRFENSGADFSDATEITFDIWTQKLSGGSNLLTRSLTGATMLIPDPTYYQFSVSPAESLALTPGKWWYENWVTDDFANRFLAAWGRFEVKDTRKHDV